MNSLQWSDVHWSPPSLELRLGVVRRLRQRVCQRRQELIQSLVRLRQVSPFEVLTSEILPFLDACAWLCRHAPRLLAPRKAWLWDAPLWMSGHHLTTRRIPFGRVLIFGPGNYPFFLPAVQALQALVAGNRVRVKPQTGCRAPLQLLNDWLVECGLAPGSLELLPDQALEVGPLIDQGVELFVLTGSCQTGRQLLPLFAQRCIPCIAELSGQDVFCLCPDGDLDDAIRALQWARRLNRGQTCMAPAEFWLPRAQISRVGRLDIPVVAYDDLTQVQEWLAVRPGLGLSLFGQRQARLLAESAQTGFVTLNDCIAPTADPRASFGGTGAAGFGATRGPEGLLAMTVSQNLFVNRGPRMHLQPPSAASHSIMRCYTDLAHASVLGRLLAAARILPALLSWMLSRRGNSTPARQGEACETLSDLSDGDQTQRNSGNQGMQNE